MFFIGLDVEVKGDVQVEEWSEIKPLDNIDGKIR